VCPNPAKPDGATCNDGSACTQTDTCLAGTCIGGNPVVCTPSDMCHGAGTCDPSSGMCSNPALVDGTLCDDGNACSQTDTCLAGTCTGTNPVVCTASDTCHTAGSCDTGTGLCSNPAKADGAGCDDGNACTQTDACAGGVCTGGDPVVCTPSDMCHDTGTCDPLTGTCSDPALPNGTACTDDSKCTDPDTCQAGVCVPGPATIVCDPLTMCDPGTGLCI
jgi:hypothetical protein